MPRVGTNAIGLWTCSLDFEDDDAVGDVFDMQDGGNGSVYHSMAVKNKNCWRVNVNYRRGRRGRWFTPLWLCSTHLHLVGCLTLLWVFFSSVIRVYIPLQSVDDDGIALGGWMLVCCVVSPISPLLLLLLVLMASAV
eukprot:m.28412 g.28412  ORF g.28412 m.28412 type:complete len:137 (+) comp10444_c0_seq2:685-1095(+)